MGRGALRWLARLGAALALVAGGAAGGGVAEESALLAEVRRGFETAPESARETRRLRLLLEERLPGDAAEWPAVFRAYGAALEGLEGKHAASPREKLRRTRAGLAAFEGLAEGHPDSFEIRMLRFSFASQLPGFFGMRAAAEADLSALADLLESGGDGGVPLDYRRDSVRWILRHGAPAPEMRRRLERALADLGGE